MKLSFKFFNLPSGAAMAAAARRDPRIIVFILRVVKPMSEQVEECLLSERVEVRLKALYSPLSLFLFEAIVNI